MRKRQSPFQMLNSLPLETPSRMGACEKSCQCTKGELAQEGDEGTFCSWSRCHTAVPTSHLESEWVLKFQSSWEHSGINEGNGNRANQEKQTCSWTTVLELHVLEGLAYFCQTMKKWREANMKMGKTPEGEREATGQWAKPTDMAGQQGLPWEAGLASPGQGPLWREP